LREQGGPRRRTAEDDALLARLLTERVDRLLADDDR
jgi:hypothetical protein